MKEIKGNVFDLALQPEVDSICITTNGVINASGLAIMGAGVAGEAARRWPSVRQNLGRCLKASGNLPYVIGFLDKENNFQNPNSKSIMNKDYSCLVWSFPTKNDFRYNSVIGLIQRSSELMVEMANTLKLNHICLPRPGCSNGKLDWASVKEVIGPILDDRFYITSFEGEE